METVKTRPQYISLIGHPNAGKSSLFNHLTHQEAKVMNYPGTTVDFDLAGLDGHSSVTIVDVPGITTLTPDCEDEVLSCQSLTQFNDLCPEGRAHPDVIISVVDCTQRSRHLLLTKQLMAAGFSVIVVLTKLDLAKMHGKALSVEKLARIMGCPVVAVNGRTGDGVNDLISSILSVTKQSHNNKIVMDRAQDINKLYRWTETVIKESQIRGEKKKEAVDWDRFLLHPVWGGLSFVTIMGVLFYSIFVLAAPLMGGVDTFFSWLIQFINQGVPAHWSVRLLTEGVIGGVASTLIFVPQILILFLGINILESTGYLARGAVIIDKPLSKVGLNGRSFVPLLSGCACAIPAMLAARNMPGRKSRTLCLFIIPLMQCSARLPVYGLLLSLLFWNQPWKSGVGLTGIYLGSLLITAIVAGIGARVLKMTQQSYFQIELPAWQRPMWGVMIKQSIQQTKRFITNAGPIIVGVSVMLWVLSVLPNETESFAMMIGKWIAPIFSPMGVDWRVGVAILLSFAAREVFVSALVVMLALHQDGAGLIASLQQITHAATGELMFTVPAIIGLILFFMVAMQCAATLAVARKEMGNWKLPLLQVGVYITLAYGLAVGAVQGLTYLGL